MKARLLLLLAALLCIVFTGCKKEDDKPLTLDDVIGSYEGETITKTNILGECTTKEKATFAVEKSKNEGEDGKITGQGFIASGFKITENKKGKLSFKFVDILVKGEGYITASTLYFKTEHSLQSEEFKGKRK